MIFIDTGAFFARSVRSDANHARALDAWGRLPGQRLFTSDLVLGETAELLARKTSYELAVENLRRIYNTPELAILRPDRDDELAAIDIMEKYADQLIGFVDCVSFVLMKRHRIKQAFSFDRHFRTAGFVLWPGGG